MSAAVIIAASNLMPALCARLAAEGELLTFADTEAAEALQTILERRPRLIVLERLFAETPRGAALITRIRNDAQLSGAELRVMSHTGDYARQVALSPPGDDAAGIDVPSVMVGEDYAAVPLVSGPEPEAAASPGPSWRGTRRAVRYQLRQNVQIQVDGNPLGVVDMSAVGAQVVSSAILRPNQRVRVSVTTDNFVMRFRATVAWAKFELSNGSEPQRYRAGLEFTDADRPAMEDYCARHKR